MSILKELEKQNKLLQSEIDNQEKIKIFKLENKKLRIENRYLHLQNRFINVVRFAGVIKKTCKSIGKYSWIILGSISVFFITLALSNQ